MPRTGSSRIFRIESLCAAHDRTQFVSGSSTLDRYFREQASQDTSRRVATCFVALSTETQEVAGYYTLSATGVALDALPREVVKKLPRYPVVPAALLGRLAVARAFQGQGLGASLLADALMRTARTELGVFAMLVDAKDEAAERFYQRFGFSFLGGNREGRLMLPIATAMRLLGT